MSWIRYVKVIRNWQHRLKQRRHLTVVKLALPIARGRLRSFRTIKSINEDVRKGMLPRMIHCEAEAALIQAKEQRMQTSIAVPLAFGITALVFITPIAINHWLQAGYGWLDMIVIWYASSLVLAAITLVLFGPWIFSNSFTSGWISTLVGVFWSAFGLVTCGFALYYIYPHLMSSQVSWDLMVIASSIVQVFVYFAGMILSLLTEAGLSMSIAARRMSRSPDSMLVDGVLQALSIVSRTDGSWMDLAAKNRLMRELEGAARIVSEGLPSALSTADLYTDTWLRSRCQEIAASLRAKKTWVCMPKADTRERLEESLTRCLIDAAFGNWDALEVSEARILTREETKVRIRTLLLGLFVPMLPAGVYRGAQMLGILQPGPLMEYLGFGVVLWAVIATLQAVDPRFGEKVEALQKLASGIPGLPKKKEG